MFDSIFGQKRNHARCNLDILEGRSYTISAKLVVEPYCISNSAWFIA